MKNFTRTFLTEIRPSGVFKHPKQPPGFATGYASSRILETNSDTSMVAQKITVFWINKVSRYIKLP